MDDLKTQVQEIEHMLIDTWQEKSRVSATDVQRVQALKAGSKLSLRGKNFDW